METVIEQRPLVRTVMALLVYPAQKDIFLLLHGKHKKWMGPGGHIEPEEMVHQAVLREIVEETGYIVDLPMDKIDERATIVAAPRWNHVYSSDEKIEEDFTYVIPVSTKIRNTKALEGEWFPIQFAIDGLDMYEDTRDQLRHILKETILDIA